MKFFNDFLCKYFSIEGPFLFMQSTSSDELFPPGTPQFSDESGGETDAQPSVSYSSNNIRSNIRSNNSNILNNNSNIRSNNNSNITHTHSVCSIL